MEPNYKLFCIRSRISIYIFHLYSVWNSMKIKISVSPHCNKLQIHEVRILAFCLGRKCQTLHINILSVSTLLTGCCSGLNQVQRHLQLRIEAQGKYLQSVLEKAQETLGRQNLGPTELEAAKVQLSEVVSKVSTECINSTVSELSELQGLCPQQAQANADCSMDSCLTMCEESQKDQEMHNIWMGLRSNHGSAHLGPKEIGDESRLEQPEPTWGKDLKENKMFPSSMRTDMGRASIPIQNSSSDSHMSIRAQGDKRHEGNNIFEARSKGGDEDENFLLQINAKRLAIKLENEKIANEFRLPHQTTKLDLNAREKNDAASSCKEFDLNSFSWS